MHIFPITFFSLLTNLWSSLDIAVCLLLIDSHTWSLKYCLSFSKENLHLKGRLCCKLPLKVMQNWVIRAAFWCHEDSEFLLYSSIQMIWYNILAGCNFSNKHCTSNDVDKHCRQPDTISGHWGRGRYWVRENKGSQRSSNIFQIQITYPHLWFSSTYLPCSHSSN